MLRCPKCKFIGQDETQIFCVSDGAKLVHLNQALELEASNGKLSRRTPPGELLFEIFMSPPKTSSASVKKLVLSNAGKPSFQMYGLRSSSILDETPETKTTNGFHSFNSLIVNDQEMEVGEKELHPTSNHTFVEDSSDIVEFKEKRQSDVSLFWYCLFGALLFLAGLAFAANYLF